MISLQQVRELWVRPALQTVNLWNPKAENFILGIGLVESSYEAIHQYGAGPAQGFWQMEPNTEKDCWENFLAFRKPLGLLVNSLRAAHTGPNDLERYPLYAAAMARVKIRRSPMGLPSTPEEAAAQHKRLYNSTLGATEPQESVKLFRKVWQ